jgi:hypothetical protein
MGRGAAPGVARDVCVHVCVCVCVCVLSHLRCCSTLRTGSVLRFHGCPRSLGDVLACWVFLSTQRVGFITETVIKECMHPPSEGLLIVVCGPPPMCRAVKRALAGVGYPDSMIYSYM